MELHTHHNTSPRNIASMHCTQQFLPMGNVALSRRSTPGPQQTGPASAICLLGWDKNLTNISSASVRQENRKVSGWLCISTQCTLYLYQTTQLHL